MISLDVSLEIYSLEKIEIAKKAYAEFAEINITSKGNRCKIIFQGCKYDSEQTIKGFENYLIGLENS